MNDSVSPAARRAAEERLRARYEAELTETVEIAVGEPTLWPVPPGRNQTFEVESGAFVESLRLEASFPDTLFVVVYRHQLRPGHRFELRWGVWTEGSTHRAEPPYNDILSINLREDIFQEIRRARPLTPDA